MSTKPLSNGGVGVDGVFKRENALVNPDGDSSSHMSNIISRQDYLLFIQLRCLRSKDCSTGMIIQKTLRNSNANHCVAIRDKRVPTHRVVRAPIWIRGKNPGFPIQRSLADSKELSGLKSF
eukprot:2656092-Amphidinium_carterae.2